MARLRRGDLKSQEAPEYLILHYAEHLDRMSNTPPERYFELLCQEWREAAIRIDKAEFTFFSDAERVFEKAKRIGVGVLGQQIRALLCRISISASGDGLSARDLRDLVQSKKAGETWAIDIARRKPTPLERSTYLCALAPLIKGQTTELLTEAVGNALALSDYWESADVLVGVIPALGSEQLPIVLDALARMSEPSRLDPLLALAEQPQFHSHRTVILDAALDCIRSIRWPYFAIDAALRIAEHATDSMRDKAIEKGIDIASEMTRVEACAAYVRLLKVASPAQKAAILKKAKVKARKLESPWRALFNLDILPYLESPHLEVTIAQLKKLAARWNMLDANLRRRLGAIPEVQTSIPSVSLVGPPTGTAVAWPSSFRSRIYNSEPGPRTLAERDSYGRVLGAYSGLASVRVQEEASASILRLTQEFPDIRSELGVLSSSLLSSSISSETLSRFLEELGPNLPARAEMLRSPTLSHRKRMQVIDELLKMVTTNSPSDRSLENLARAICEYPNPAVRKRWTTPLDAPELPSGLARLRTFVARADVKWALDEGIKAIRSIPNLELRTEQLISIAESLPEGVRGKQIRDAVQWVRRINDPRKRALLFCRLSDFLAGEEAKAVIRKARRAYDKIEDAAKRKRAARQIVFRVNESELKIYLSEAVPGLMGRHKYIPRVRDTGAKMTDAQFFLLDFVEYRRGAHQATLYQDIVHAVWQVAYDARSKDGRPNTRGAWLEALAVVAGCMPTTESRRMGHEIRAACSRRKGERAGEILIEMGARFPAAEVLEFCPELLADSAIIEMLDDARRRTRGDLYRLLAALAPVIFRIGGQSAVDQVLESLVQSAIWWPVDGGQRNAF